MADGYLTFDTKLNTAGFKSGLGQVTGMFTKLAALAGVAFSVGAVVAFGKAAVQAASQAEAKFKGLDFLMKANGRSMSEATSFIKEFTADGLVPMTSAYEAYKNMVSRGYSTEQIEKMLSVMKDAAVYNRQGQFTMGEAIEKTTMGLRMENSLLTDSVGIQKNVAKMWQEYAKSIGTTANNLTMLQKRQAEFEGFMAEGGVFAGAAAEYADSYAGRIAGISAAFQNLKVAVGNAVIPFINALLPAITNAILWFTKLFNIVGQVVNLLFGTNVGMVDAEAAIAGSAEQTAAATEQTAANTEAAGKAAKGALASFDKLNVLAQDTSSGGGGAGVGGGGGGGTVIPLPELDKDGGLTGELDELQEKIKKFIADTKTFLAPLQEPFNKLGVAFQTLGNNIIKGLGWAWNNILKPFGAWIVTAVAPVAINILTGAVNVLNAVITALQPLGIWLWEKLLQPIAAWTGGIIVAVLEGMATGLNNLSTWISTYQQAVETIAIDLGSLATAIGLVWAALMTYKAVIIGINTVTALWGLITSAAILPIVLITAGIAALIAIGVLLWKNWDKIKEWGVQAWEVIQDAWKVAATWFNENVVQPIKDYFEPMFTLLGILANNAWVVIKYVWGVVSDWFNTNVISPISTAFTTAWDAISLVVTNVWTAIETAWQGAKTWFDTNILNPISEAFTSVWTAISDAAETAFSTVASVIKGALNGVIGVLNSMLSFAFGGINDLINTINNVGSVIPGWRGIPTITVPQIQYLASGAVIPPNAPFMAVMGDQRRGTNLEAPEALIRQIVREEAGGMGGTIVVRFEGTMGALIRELKPQLEFESSRVGNSMVAKAVRI